MSVAPRNSRCIKVASFRMSHPGIADENGLQVLNVVGISNREHEWCDRLRNGCPDKFDFPARVDVHHLFDVHAQRLGGLTLVPEVDHRRLPRLEFASVTLPTLGLGRGNSS